MPVERDNRGRLSGRRAWHCHSPQNIYSLKSTCCVLSAQESTMFTVVNAGNFTIQHSIHDIIDWWCSYWHIWYSNWCTQCSCPCKQKRLLYISILPQYQLWEIIPYQVSSWKLHTIDHNGSIRLLIDTWLNMLMFNVRVHDILHFKVQNMLPPVAVSWRRR